MGCQIADAFAHLLRRYAQNFIRDQQLIALYGKKSWLQLVGSFECLQKMQTSQIPPKMRKETTLKRLNPKQMQKKTTLKRLKQNHIVEKIEDDLAPQLRGRSTNDGDEKIVTQLDPQTLGL